MLFVLFPLLVLSGCSKDPEPAGEEKDEVLVSGISLDEQKLELSVDSKAQLNATVTPYSYEGTLDWVSSHPEVASVDDKGNITALAEGETIVTVTAENKKAVCNVVVYENKAEIGSYYYSDGSVTDRILETKTAIGVVFWLGDPTASDAVLKKDHPGCTHGLVVSLDQTMSCWQSKYDNDRSKTVGAWVSAKRPDLESPLTGVKMEDNLNKIIGYNNTIAIEAFNEAPENSDKRVDAVDAVADFRAAVKAPESSSGWYLPSAKELTLLCIGEYDENIYNTEGTVLVEMKDRINKVLDKLDEARSLSPSVYWASSEGSFEGAYNVYFDDGDTSASYKDFKNGVVRCILAF